MLLLINNLSIRDNMLFFSFGRYEACMDVTDSDHKPVRCTFSVDIARVDELTRRQEYGKIIESNKKVCGLLQESHFVPDTIMSTNNIILENSEDVVLRITNNSETNKAAFEILCEGQWTRKQDGTRYEILRRASFGFPFWLEVEANIFLVCTQRLLCSFSNLPLRCHTITTEMVVLLAK
jgi:hypothetical protein